MEVFVVRHKPTGFFIPVGGTKVEPISITERPPRIFISKPSAQGFITQWIRGINEDDGAGMTVTLVLTRNYKDMEIVTCPFNIPV